MAKAISVFLAGLILLTILSFFWGRHVFTTQAGWFQENQVGQAVQSDSTYLAERQARIRKARIIFGSFDLVNGLTTDDLENLLFQPHHRYFAFVWLLACLWMVWGLRKARSPL